MTQQQWMQSVARKRLVGAIVFCFVGSVVGIALIVVVALAGS